MKIYLIFTFLFFNILYSFGQSNDQTGKLLPKDFREIFQLAIDHSQLQEYYHIDADSTRKQIIFEYFGNANHDNLKGVIKFDRQVIIMTEDEIKEKKVENYFSVSDWVCGTNSVRLQLYYTIENQLASYMFQKVNDTWTITNFYIDEVVKD